MSGLDPRYLEHFRAPRHAGRLDAPDAEVSRENPVCGDELTLGLALSEGRIARLGFLARGCSGSIAAASALCELALGRTPSEAQGLDRAAIEAAIGELPRLKRHGADLAVEALRGVLAALPPSPPPEAARAAVEETS